MDRWEDLAGRLEKQRDEYPVDEMSMDMLLSALERTDSTAKFPAMRVRGIDFPAQDFGLPGLVGGVSKVPAKAMSKAAFKADKGKMVNNALDVAEEVVTGKSGPPSPAQVNVLLRDGMSVAEINGLDRKAASVAIDKIAKRVGAKKGIDPLWDGTATREDKVFQDAYTKWSKGEQTDEYLESIVNTKPQAQIPPPVAKGAVAPLEETLIDLGAKPVSVEEVVHAMPSSDPLKVGKVTGKKAFGPVAAKHITSIDDVLGGNPGLRGKATDLLKEGKMNPKKLAERLESEAAKMKQQSTVHDARWVGQDTSENLPAIFKGLPQSESVVEGALVEPSQGFIRSMWNKTPKKTLVTGLGFGGVGAGLSAVESMMDDYDAYQNQDLVPAQPMVDGNGQPYKAGTDKGTVLTPAEYEAKLKAMGWKNRP